jgi:uncharacterized protein
MHSSPTLQQLNKNLIHRPVRDLAWAIFNPPLFRHSSTIPTEYLTPIWQDDGLYTWLYTLDADPLALFKHLEDQRATRLGIYFEQLLSFYFAEYPRFSLLAKNLQANNDQRTIGEYDFIIWDKQALQHYHIEVAVKFYIGLQTLESDIANNTPLHNWHLWVGPNKKDTLGIKMNHLIHHQLPLAKTDAGKNALSAIGLKPEQIQSILLLTGRLYYPLQQNPAVSKVDLPKDSLHTLIDCSRWLYKAELEQHADQFLQEGHRYIILPRQLWMSAITNTDIADYSLTPINREHFIPSITDIMRNDSTPLHIAEITPISAGKSIETRRFFLLESIA